VTLQNFDVVIVGGGIVGLATAYGITDADPDARVAIVEKEGGVARHQSGRNSGVLHSGIYYRPGSRKAEFTALGRASMLQFCEAHEIPYDMCGKPIVASELADIPRLEALEARARGNKVRARRLTSGQMAEVEPSVHGLGALHVADAGVVDFAQVSRVLEDVLRSRGVELHLGRAVTGLKEGSASVVVVTDAGGVEASFVVNCAGLHADRLSGGPKMTQQRLRIIPFRGEFFELAEAKRSLVRGLVYPVPDPAFPFLGVHLNRGIDGRVMAGPNAVLGLAREGYSWRAVEWREIGELLRYRGMRRLARRHWRTGVREVLRSFSTRRFERDLQRLVPEIRRTDLTRAPAGVRAQAVSRDGELLDDFEIAETARAVHVLNAPSPGATASLEIGRTIAGMVAKRRA